LPGLRLKIRFLFIFLADSWKFSEKKIELEKRSFREIWKFGKGKNFAFEFIPKKFIRKIVTEKN